MLYKGLQSSEETELVAKIATQLLQELQYNWREAYQEIDDAYRYLAGEQYTAAQRKYYASFRRPTDVFNIYFSLYNTAFGDFIQNIQPLNVLPRPGGSREVAEALRKVRDNFHIDCDFDDQVLKTAAAAMNKVGYMLTEWSNEKHINGGIYTRNLDEYECGFDSRAREELLDDAEYMWRSTWLSSEAILATWPEKKRILRTYLREREEVTFWDSLAESYKDFWEHPELIDEKDGQYRVLEWHQMKYEPIEVAYDPQTDHAEILSLTGAKREIFLRSRPHLKVMTLNNRKVKYIHTCLPGAGIILESKRAPLQDECFDIVPISAYNYGRRTIDYFGVFRNVKGPQNNFNQWRNTTQHIINKSANPAWITKPAALENPQDIDQFGSEPNLHIKVKDAYDINQVVKPGDPPRYPFATDKMQEEAAELVQRITGITPNQVGLQDTSSENATLFVQRVKQSRMGLGVIYRNLRRAKLRIADKELKLIQQNLTYPRYFLITNPRTQEQEELIVNQKIGETIMNDLTLGSYQVFQDDMDQDPTSRQMRFLEKKALAEWIASMLGPMAIDYEWLLEDAPLGDVKKLVTKVNEVLAAQGQSAAQAAAMEGVGNLVQLAQQKQQLDNQADAGSPSDRGPAQSANKSA